MISAIPDDGKENKRFSEASLPNAIANENEDLDEDVVEEVKIDYPAEDFEISDDYQLQQVIKLLKDGTYDEKLAEAQG